MVTADDLRPLRKAAPDYEQTENLKADLDTLRRSREPLYLKFEEIDRVFLWKLDRQYGRQKELRNQTSTETYEAVTRACFAFRMGDVDTEARVRLSILTALPGVGVPVASAVLALGDPSRYCVIDFRGWRAVYDLRRASFAIGDYIKYREFVSVLAVELGWCVQETDLAIWELDRRRNGVTLGSIHHSASGTDA